MFCQLHSLADMLWGWAGAVLLRYDRYPWKSGTQTPFQPGILWEGQAWLLALRPNRGINVCVSYANYPAWRTWFGRRALLPFQHLTGICGRAVIKHRFSLGLCGKGGQARRLTFSPNLGIHSCLCYKNHPAQ